MFCHDAIENSVGRFNFSRRSVAIFVCQYHLSNLTTDLVRLMTGADQPATYGVVESTQPSPPGGLFNEAG